MNSRFIVNIDVPCPWSRDQHVGFAQRLAQRHPMRMRHNAAAQAIVQLLVIAVIAGVVACVHVALSAIIFKTGGAAVSNAMVLIALLHAVAEIVLIQRGAADSSVLGDATVPIGTGAERGVDIVIFVGDIVIMMQPLAQRQRDIQRKKLVAFVFSRRTTLVVRQAPRNTRQGVAISHLH